MDDLDHPWFHHETTYVQPTKIRGHLISPLALVGLAKSSQRPPLYA